MAKVSTDGTKIKKTKKRTKSAMPEGEAVAKEDNGDGNVVEKNDVESGVNGEEEEGYQHKPVDNATHEKYEEVKKGELHITDLQKMTVESLYELIRRKVRDGMTQRDVAEELGHSRNTVAKALKHPIPPGYRMAKPPQLALF